MRVLVTGGAGFIGSHLCEFLLDQGCDVVAMDNFITGSADNMAAIATRPGFAFVFHNVTEYIAVDGPIDWVLHFASPASPRDYLELPIPTLKVGALGTHNALGLAKAKGARFLIASTSEVYGNPLVHPQREDYWGNVNPIGPRGVYDEAKRFAEAITMAYHRYHGLSTRIVRIFNSIAADETTVVFDNDEMHWGSVEDYVGGLERGEHEGLKIQVPAFDPTTFRISLRDVSAVIKHPIQTDMYEIRTRYGRRVRVTADHSVFRRASDGTPEAVPVIALQPGDDIAIPAALPVIEKDRGTVTISRHLLATRADADLWDYAVVSPSLVPVIEERREDIHAWLERSGRVHARRLRNGIGRAINDYRRLQLLPLAVVKALDIEVPDHARIRMFKAGAHASLPDRLAITSDVLWLIGFFLAEGRAYAKGKNCLLTFPSNPEYVDKARCLLEEHFGLHVVTSVGGAPAISVHSKILHILFDEIFKLLGERIPSWILQLPLHRLKWFVEGYREGDGTHSGKKIGHELSFHIANEARARDLTLILLRFGIVGAVGNYETTFRKKHGDRRFPFWRVTVGEVSNFDVLSWDRGVVQTLNARRLGDLVWAKVRSVEKTIATPFVYDFSVPDAENFFGGNGVACHNTYGPRMRLNDGRAIPTFITQALTGAPLTVYGDGSQTRSFQYVSDLIDGMWRLIQSNETDPVNLGNPQEMTLLELAQRIIALAGTKNDIVFRPLPQDDPRVRQPDITRARTLLGWEPRVDTDTGLRLTIDWYRQRLGG